MDEKCDRVSWAAPVDSLANSIRRTKKESCDKWVNSLAGFRIPDPLTGLITRNQKVEYLISNCRLIWAPSAPNKKLKIPINQQLSTLVECIERSHDLWHTNTLAISENLIGKVDRWGTAVVTSFCPVLSCPVDWNANF